MITKTNIKKLKLKLTIVLLCISLFSCNQEFIENDLSPDLNGIPGHIVSKLEAAGFDISLGLRKYRDGYLVEKDFYFTEEVINQLGNNKTNPNDPAEEHYTSDNLIAVNGMFRIIRVFMDPTFDAFVDNALNDALNRYNNENLILKFERTADILESDIRILPFFDNSADAILGLSTGFGYPQNGDPNDLLIVNTFFYNNATRRADVVTMLTHEIGHAIGFRHTDYMDTSFSCGGDFDDEGQSIWGANHVPGTPQGPSAGSIMLSCSPAFDRPFTADDINAFNTVYGFEIMDITGVGCEGTGTFSLNDNLSPGSTVTWEVAPAELFVQANGVGTDITLDLIDPSYTGDAVITFTIENNGFTFTGNGEIWFGVPEFYLNWEYNSVNRYTYININSYEVEDLAELEITNVEWEKLSGSGNLSRNGEFGSFVRFPYSSPLTRPFNGRATVTNECGQFVYLFTITPPATGGGDPDDPFGNPMQ